MNATTPPAAAGALTRFGRWLRDDIDRAAAAIVCFGLGGVALAGSATHVLHVGEYPDVQVTGWMVWTVAGSLEVLAAYAAWEVRRRAGWDRLIPLLVLIASAAFIVLANLAAADQQSWAADLPWAQAFAVAPPVSFISVSAIAETRGWDRPRRKGSKPAAKAGSAKGSNPAPAQVNRPEPSTLTPAATPAAAAARPHLVPAPARSTADPDGLTVEPGEDQLATVTRWVQEGHTWAVMMRAGQEQFGVSEPTMKRRINAARESLEAVG